MKRLSLSLLFVFMTFVIFENIKALDLTSKTLYTFPEESEPHTATWLSWPHQYQYGKTYRNSLDGTWVELTRQLVQSEKVSIIAYNLREKKRIISMLEEEEIPLTNVEFYLFPTDDFWIRDNGPIFVLTKKTIW